MSTNTVTPLSTERQQRSVDLLTRTTVTKQNYDSLYVTNPQVNCICRIWNRIVYCLVSWWLGWCLGEAGDIHGKVSMKQENTLIQNYNQAKKTLLEAINAKNTGSYPKTEEHYLKALNARIDQIGTFGYSASATQKGCKIEKSQFFEAAEMDLKKALKEGIYFPLSLSNMLRPGVQVNRSSSETLSTPTKKDIENERRRAKEELLNSFCKGPSEDPLNEEAAEQYFKTIEDEVNTAPNDLDVSRKALEEIRFATCTNQWSADKRLKLFLLFAKRFDVPTKDPEFLTRFDILIRPEYERGLQFFTSRNSPGPLVVLKNYSQSLQAIHDAQKLETDSVSYVKKQFCSLLSEIHKQHGQGYEQHYNTYSEGSQGEKIFPHNRQICALAKHLPYFASTANTTEQALGLQFIETVLNFQPEDSKASSQPVPATPSASTSQSSSSSISSSSTTSQPVPTTTTQVLPTRTEPVKQEPEFQVTGYISASDAYLSARDALLKEFAAKEKFELISKALIQDFVRAARHYQANQPYDALTLYEALLQTVQDKLLTVQDKLRIANRVPYSNEVFTLKIRLAKELGICTEPHLSREITLMIQKTFQWLSPFNPHMIFTYVPPGSPTPYSDFYRTIKNLATAVNPDGNPTTYAKEKLKELFKEVYKKEGDDYRVFAGLYREVQDTTTIKLLVQIADALPGFGKSPNEFEKAAAERLLNTIAV